MDKRIEKTKAAIKEAFMELRKTKTLGQISIKELCEQAYINKSTFYTHYENIYALSDAIEHDTVLSIISSIPKGLDYSFTNPELFTREVTIAFTKHLPEVSIIFSGKNQAHLSTHLEGIIKKLIYQRFPENQNNTELNILLSYCIHGAYNATLSNPEADPDTILRILEHAAIALRPLFAMCENKEL